MSEIAIVGLYGYLVMLTMWIGSNFANKDRFIGVSWGKIFIVVFTIPIITLVLMFIKDAQ